MTDIGTSATDSDPSGEPDLRVVVGDIELAADWTDDAPETRAAVEAALPLEGEATRWGDELYFGTTVDVGLENARAAVPVGALAYWPTGSAVCLFWGPTPASDGEKPRAASPVNVFARVRDTEPLSTNEGSLSAVDGGTAVVVDAWRGEE